MRKAEIDAFVEGEVKFVEQIANKSLSVPDVYALGDCLYNHISEAYKNVYGSESSRVFFIVCTNWMFCQHSLVIGKEFRCKFGQVYSAAWKRFFVEQETAPK